MATSVGQFTDEKSLLSIVAGTRMKALADGMQHPGIIRVMPKHPRAQIGRRHDHVDVRSPPSAKTHRGTTAAILSTIGDEIYVDDEKYLDMATALKRQRPGLRVPDSRSANRRRGVRGPAP